MVRPSNSLALLKALIAAAWADARLSQTELNYVKDLARRFGLNDSEWFELQPYLEDPPGAEETKAILSDLLARVGSHSERQAIISHVKAVIRSDDRISEEEKVFLRQFEEIFQGPSSFDLLFGRMKNLLAASPRRSAVDMDEFLRNKILFKLRRKAGDGQITPDMHRLALLGGLMGIVAQADGEIDERELTAIRRELERRGTFGEETLDLLVGIIRDESVRGLDRYPLITEYAGGCSLEDRTELLDLLFMVAAADGGLTHPELEELRSISSALQLSHRQYIGAKVRARDMRENAK